MHETDGKIRVAALRCPGYEQDLVYDGIREALGLIGGIGRFVGKGERILLKPNLLSAKPAEAAVTTHPAVVRAVIRLVQEAGATAVVGDSPGLGSPVKIAEKCGILDAVRETGAEFVEFRDVVKVENPGGRTFKRLEIARDAVEADGIINLPKLKTHAQMHLTLGVKNMFGCVPGKRKPQWHLAAGVDSLHFAGMLLDLFTYLSPRLTIMDGIVGMEGNGPGSGTPRELGLLFASGSAVAMDSVIAEVLGAAPEDLPLAREAGRRGIPGSSLDDVEVAGEEIDAIRVRSFEFPPLISLNFAELLPNFMGRHVRRALTSRPHVDHKECTLCRVCVEVCPAGVMTSSGRIEIDYDSCIRCYCCQEMCPHGAISSRDGWLKRLIPGL